MNMKECIIINLYNDSMLELAENQLLSFKKVGITKYLSFTTGEYSYHYLKKKGYNVVLYNTDDLQLELQWGSDKFIDMVRLRFKLISELLKEYKSVFYLDVDIVLLKNIEPFFETNIEKCLYIQHDLNMPCIGCMLLHRNDTLCNMLNEIIGFANGNTSLQIIFSHFVKRYNLNFDFFPIETFPNGLIFFGENNIIMNDGNKHLLKLTKNNRIITKNNFKNKNIFLIHANYMTGTESKKKAFNDFNLWYL